MSCLWCSLNTLCKVPPASGRIFVPAIPSSWTLRALTACHSALWETTHGKAVPWCSKTQLVFITSKPSALQPKFCWHQFWRVSHMCFPSFNSSLLALGFPGLWQLLTTAYGSSNSPHGSSQLDPKLPYLSYLAEVNLTTLGKRNHSWFPETLISWFCQQISFPVSSIIPSAIILSVHLQYNLCIIFQMSPTG